MANSQVSSVAVDHVKEQYAVPPASQGSSSSHPDGLILALISIMQSLNIQQETAQAQCKVMESNAKAQETLNQRQDKENFIVFTKNMIYNNVEVRNHHSKMIKEGPQPGDFFDQQWTTVEIQKQKDPNALEKIQSSNMQIQKTRDGVANEMLILRQKAQIAQTELGATVNQGEQTVSEFAQITGTLLTITNQIVQRG